MHFPGSPTGILDLFPRLPFHWPFLNTGVPLGSSSSSPSNPWRPTLISGCYVPLNGSSFLKINLQAKQMAAGLLLCDVPQASKTQQAPSGKHIVLPQHSAGSPVPLSAVTASIKGTIFSQLLKPETQIYSNFLPSFSCTILIITKFQKFYFLIYHNLFTSLLLPLYYLRPHSF